MTSGSSDCFNCLLSGASLTGIASVDYSNFGFVLVQLRFRLVALAFVRVSPLTSVYYTGTVVDSGPVLNTLTNQVDCFTTSLFFSFILLSIRQGRPSCEHHAVLVIKISGLLFGSRAVAKYFEYQAVSLQAEHGCFQVCERRDRSTSPCR